MKDNMSRKRYSAHRRLEIKVRLQWRIQVHQQCIGPRSRISVILQLYTILNNSLRWTGPQALPINLKWSTCSENKSASNIIIKFSCMYINKKKILIMEFFTMYVQHVLYSLEKNWFFFYNERKSSRWTFLSSLVVVLCSSCTTVHTFVLYV